MGRSFLPKVVTTYKLTGFQFLCQELFIENMSNTGNQWRWTQYLSRLGGAAEL